MTRRQIMAALAAAAFAACSRSEPSRATPAEARRVVSITPATTEALFAVGAGDRVVGRSRFCDWPPEAAKVPIVGGFVDVDVEAILQLRPDLVVGAPGPPTPRLAEQLAVRGVGTWWPGVESLVAIKEMILGLGERTAHAAEARRIASEVTSRVALVERSLAGEPAPRVLVVLDVGPVVAAGPGSFVDELLRRARAANVLLAGHAWQALGFEQIVEIDPDLIVDLSGGNGPASDAGEPRITGQAAGWSGVRAVREGHVVATADPRVLRPGPRVAEGLAVLARALHPGAAVPVW
jgi:iron complex transport system substrate-binding protein